LPRIIDWIPLPIASLTAGNSATSQMLGCVEYSMAREKSASTAGTSPKLCLFAGRLFVTPARYAC